MKAIKFLADYILLSMIYDIPNVEYPFNEVSITLLRGPRPEITQDEIVLYIDELVQEEEKPIVYDKFQYLQQYKWN